MAAQTLTLAGRRFVILPESEYRKLRGKNGVSRPAKPAKPRRQKYRLTAQDRGDIAEAKRRLADPNDKAIPWSEARKQLGLE